MEELELMNMWRLFRLYCEESGKICSLKVFPDLSGQIEEELEDNVVVEWGSFDSDPMGGSMTISQELDSLIRLKSTGG